MRAGGIWNDAKILAGRLKDKISPAQSGSHNDFPMEDVVYEQC
jgi:hypothetical protein